MIRVLVAEDSATYRQFLVALLRSDGELQVVGEARDGAEAVAMTKRLHPDVVTMDINMPRLNGFEATRSIMIDAPTPIVIVSGSTDRHEVEYSMNALHAGALTVLAKPAGPDAPDFDSMRKRFLDTIKAMSQVKVVRHWARRCDTQARAFVTPHRSGRPIRVLAICASTGGPSALFRLLADLRGDLKIPVLVTQHLAPEFISGLAEWLNSGSALKVKVAEDGELPQPGVVYLAPDGRHLGISPLQRIALSRDAPIGGFRPSGTYLFGSVAKVYGASAAALIMTGMGRDGVDGLRELSAAGGHVIAQDEQSCVVFGMPAEAISAGYADCVLPLTSMADYLNDLLR